MTKINPEEADLCCDSCEVHENLVKIVNETMPDETELYDLAELFKVFGDSTRIQILFVLFEAEVCVCDLAEALHMTQSAISHQLRINRSLLPVLFCPSDKVSDPTLSFPNKSRTLSLIQYATGEPGILEKLSVLVCANLFSGTGKVFGSPFSISCRLI